MISLEDAFGMLRVARMPGGTLLIEVDSRPLLLTTPGGFSRGVDASMELSVDGGPGSPYLLPLRLDRLYHRANGSYGWLSYMGHLNATRGDAISILAAAGFNRNTLRRAAARTDEPRVVGRAALHVGVALARGSRARLVIYVDDLTDLFRSRPRVISTLSLNEYAVDTPLGRLHRFEWSHDPLGEAWVAPRIPRAEQGYLADSAWPDKLQLALENVGFGPEALAFAFAGSLRYLSAEGLHG